MTNLYSHFAHNTERETSMLHLHVCMQDRTDPGALQQELCCSTVRSVDLRERAQTLTPVLQPLLPPQKDVCTIGSRHRAQTPMPVLKTLLPLWTDICSRRGLTEPILAKP